MGSLRLGYLSFAAIVVECILFRDIDCVEKDDLPSELYTTGRFTDVASAINFMHNHLPADIDWEEKCKRYALLASRDIAPPKSTVSYIASIDDEQLDKYYGQMDRNEISIAFMKVIERYRVTELAPPFMDIIECLRRIDTPAVRAYLSHQELVIIMNLYKQALGLPGTVIDIASLDLTKFHPSYRHTLLCLFGKYFDGLARIADQLKTRSCSLDQWHIDEAKRGRLRLQLQARRRERDRLSKQRKRMMNPQFVREQNRQNQFRRRCRVRDIRRQWRLINPVSNDPEEVERLAKEIRDRETAGQPIRREQLKERRPMQQEQSESGLPPVPGSESVPNPPLLSGQASEPIHSANAMPSFPADPMNANRLDTSSHASHERLSSLDGQQYDLFDEFFDLCEFEFYRAAMGSTGKQAN